MDHLLHQEQVEVELEQPQQMLTYLQVLHPQVELVYHLQLQDHLLQEEVVAVQQGKIQMQLVLEVQVVEELLKLVLMEQQEQLTQVVVEVLLVRL